MPTASVDYDGARQDNLWIMSSDLALLASRAAIELGDYIRDSAQKLPSVIALAKILTANLGRGNGSLTRGDIDPSSAAVFHEAYSHAYHAHPASANELLAAATGVVDELRKLAPESLPQLRQFCLNLSRSARLYRELAYGSRPVPPYYRK